ncbi:hypothetical protein AQ912_03030 [Burkholderia pseudomallei]|nr:hypothetical protein AQ912_03030 [Burkholderia pseudomallei]
MVNLFQCSELTQFKFGRLICHFGCDEHERQSSQSEQQRHNFLLADDIEVHCCERQAATSNQPKEPDFFGLSPSLVRKQGLTMLALFKQFFGCAQDEELWL